MTGVDPIARSPLAERFEAQRAEMETQSGWLVARSFGSPEREAAAARDSVAIADESHNGKVIIRGTEAEPLFEEVFGESPAIGAGVQLAEGAALRMLFRLRGDIFFGRTAPGEEGKSALAGLRQGAKEAGFVTITDITHGRSEFRLVGPSCTELLSKVCGLDFHAARFPDLGARETSLAKTKQLLIRNDVETNSGGQLRSFCIIGGRALGTYVWDTLVEAGAEFGMRPIGTAGVGLMKTG